MAVNEANATTLIGSWINMLFYMLEIILAFKYFQRPNRPLLHRIGVAIFIVADTACTVGICWQAYLVLLIFPCADLTRVFLNSLYWPISIVILSTYATASVEQAFLCALFYSLTKRRFITGFLVFTIFFHLGFSWASAALVLKQQNPGGKAFIATQIGAISCAATDFLIAVALSVTFYRLENRTVKGRTTQSILRRLAVLSLTSGCIVASITLLALVTLLKGKNVYIIFFNCQGRAYALTVLANFLLGLPAGVTGSGDNASTRNASSRRTPRNDATGVVFHVDYMTRSVSNIAHPESLNLEELSDNVKSDNIKSHPDPD
ncbi:hypothetical protein MVEN_00343900 [Mycena venus]|uniref:DUF6534 domain-containing protein n=1 Tax=Mycena venus TaxID=2733690 RepID=A0A8H6YTX5_9AGAR|nr:hypothetical protein MVEN_00343900 [Mycena venus]